MDTAQTGEMHATRSHGVIDLTDRIRRRRVAGARTASSFPAHVPADAVQRHPSARPSADQRQAVYFVRVLLEEAALIELRIDKCRKAIAISEACGDTQNVRGFRRLLRGEERDREAIEELLGKLRLRFPTLPASEYPRSFGGRG